MITKGLVISLGSKTANSLSLYSEAPAVIIFPDFAPHYILWALIPLWASPSIAAWDYLGSTIWIFLFSLEIQLIIDPSKFQEIAHGCPYNYLYSLEQDYFYTSQILIDPS